MIAPNTNEAEPSGTMSMMTHPYAEIFPMIGERQLKELADDIRVNGLRDPITKYEGKILDGRHRYLACGIAGVEPHFEEWSGKGSPVRFVWSRNNARRHLDSSQRAAAATVFNDMLTKEAKERMSRGARLTINKGVANLPHPDPDHANADTVVTPLTDSEKGRARDKMAEIAHVSPRLIQDAKRVQDESPEMFEQVKSGELTVNGALNRIKNGDAAGMAKKPITADPLLKFTSAAGVATKAAGSVVALRPAEVKHSGDLNRAINSLGFAYSQLVPLLASSGDVDAIKQARRTIAALAAIQLDPGPEDLTRKASEPVDGAPVASGPETQMPGTTEAGHVDAALLEWPSESGLKVVIPARSIKAAIKSACIAALSDDGQSTFSGNGNEARGCVHITATDDRVVFESAVPRFCSRHVISTRDGLAVIEKGEACVSAKEFKKMCRKLLCSADAISMSFTMKLVEDEPWPRARAIKLTPDGVVAIGVVQGNKVVATTMINSYPTANFPLSEFSSTNETKVLLSGSTATFKEPYCAVSFAINPKDLNEIFGKVAIFDGGDTVHFVGTDSKRFAMAPARRSRFEKSSNFVEYSELPLRESDTATVVGKRLIPLLIDVEYLDPIIAASKNDDVMTIATDETRDYVFIDCGASAYRFYRLDKAVAEQYPDYRRMLGMPIGPVFLVDRDECLAALETVRQANQDRTTCTFSRQEKTIKLTGRLGSCVATSQLSYEQVSVSPLQSETIYLHPGYFREALGAMESDRVRISFSVDELKMRVEDEIDPKFVCWVLCMLPSVVV